MIEQIAQLAINVVMFGSVYALVGGGFSLVYGVMNVLNAAHGGFLMIGAYVTYWLVTTLAVDPLLVLPVTAVVLFAGGFAFQRAFLDRLLGVGIFMTFVLTFGLDMILTNIALVAWGADLRQVHTSYASAVIHVGTLSVPVARLIVLAVAVAMIALLVLFLSRTRTGLAIKATALEREAAQLAGIDIRWIYALTFAIATALAAVAGGLLAPIYAFNPFVGASFLGKAFAVSVLGGLGSITGALYAGFALALAETLTAIFVGAQWSDAVAFIVLIAVLMVRPRGLLGKEYFADVKV
jgi:branched-chain amino acid transport system permease protein